MKQLLIVCFIFFSSNSFSQFNFQNINIDGTVSFSEIQDTVHWKTIQQNNQVIIRESNTSFYICILSNVYSSVNAYLTTPTGIKILHISYSLGDADFVKNEKNKWTPLEKKYHWKFRDPILRNTSDEELNNEIEEFYSDEIMLEMELLEFYKNNRWVSTTMPIGSYRECEILISKKLIEDIQNVSLSFYFKDEEGKNQLSYYPQNLTQITDKKAHDVELQNGNLLEIEKFNIEK